MTGYLTMMKVLICHERLNVKNISEVLTDHGRLNIRHERKNLDRS